MPGLGPPNTSVVLWLGNEFFCWFRTKEHQHRPQKERQISQIEEQVLLTQNVPVNHEQKKTETQRMLVLVPFLTQSKSRAYTSLDRNDFHPSKLKDEMSYPLGLNLH